MTQDTQQTTGQADTIELRTIRGWFDSSIKAEVWRDRLEEDARFLDNDQWGDTEKKDLLDRGQQPLVLNQIHRDYYLQLGRQIRNRLQPTAKPRGTSDPGLARGLTDCMLYLLDVNLWDYEQTQAIKDQLLGRGWIKVSYQRDDLTREPIKIEHVPWSEMHVDPSSRRLTLEDASHLHHVRWALKSDVKAMFPNLAEKIDGIQSSDKGGANSPTKRYEPVGGDQYDAARDRGEAYTDDHASRDCSRIKLVETWYKRRIMAWQAIYPDGRVEPIDRQDANAVLEAAYQGAQVVYGPFTQFYQVIWCGELVLHQQPSPYVHGMFPFFCFHAYRASVTRRTDEVVPGEPFGMIRLAKHPQMLLNSTFTKVRHILNGRGALMEPGAADEQEVAEQLGKPNPIIKVKTGKRFEIINMLEHASGLEGLIPVAKDQMQASTGVNEASRGVGPEQSGKALFARQQQSEVTNTYLVDLQRLAIHMIGLALVSMIRQSYKAEKIIRITEDQRDRIVALNVTDPARAKQIRDGMMAAAQEAGVAPPIVQVYGSVAQGSYDVIVDEIEATSSRKEMDNELMVSLTQGMDPTTRLAILDLLVENTELRTREEMIGRIKRLQDMAGIGEQAQQQQAMAAQGMAPGPGPSGMGPPAAGGMPPGMDPAMLQQMMAAPHGPPGMPG